MAQAFAVMEDEPIEALRLCNDVLRDDPDHVAALFMTGCLQSRAEHFGAALSLFERVTRLQPNRHEAWNNAGLAYQECGQPGKARERFKRALEIEKRASYMANLGAAYLNDGNYTEAARWCRKSLELEDNDGAHTTLGFAQLAQGDWSGWKGYEHCLGGRFRKIEQIGDEPKWDGSPVDDLYIYGEQGLGDEIMYASIVPDALPLAKRVVLECDKRLKGLFQRSFPTVEVRGTRREAKPWAVSRRFDAGCASGSLAALFRTDRGACPKRGFLVADGERRLQWRSLFDLWRKPVIGLCWSGGRAATQRRERAVGLGAFRAFIAARPDVQFVSLQYTDATDEIRETGLPVKHIHRAVQSPDYDDTAAFVAELDEIVGIHTTIHHLAGALGKPSTVLVPSRPMWNYATGEGLPWYAAQTFHRQRDGESWADCIRRLP